MQNYQQTRVSIPQNSPVIAAEAYVHTECSSLGICKLLCVVRVPTFFTPYCTVAGEPVGAYVNARRAALKASKQ